MRLRGRIPSVSADTQEKALEQLKLLAQLLGAIADGPLNVPVLKGVSRLDEQVVTIAQVGLPGAACQICGAESCF